MIDAIYCVVAYVVITCCRALRNQINSKQNIEDFGMIMIHEKPNVTAVSL